MHQPPSDWLTGNVSSSKLINFHLTYKSLFCINIRELTMRWRLCSATAGGSKTYKCQATKRFHSAVAPRRQLQTYCCVVSQKTWVLLLYFFLLGTCFVDFCSVYCKNNFIILRSSFLGFLLSKKSKQNVSLVNQLDCHFSAFVLHVSSKIKSTTEYKQSTEIWPS